MTTGPGPRRRHGSRHARAQIARALRRAGDTGRPEAAFAREPVGRDREAEPPTAAAKTPDDTARAIAIEARRGGAADVARESRLDRAPPRRLDEHDEMAHEPRHHP